MTQEQDEMAELLGIFRAESADHILTISQGILQLEKDPANREVLEEIFRSAHSLKGAARLIGFKDIEVIAHRMEDVLNATRKGEIRFESQTADQLYQGLDSIKAAVERLGRSEEEGQGPLAEVGQRLGDAWSVTTEVPPPPATAAPPAPLPPPSVSTPPPLTPTPSPRATHPALPGAVPPPAVARARALVDHVTARSAVAPVRAGTPAPAPRAPLLSAVTVDETIRVTTKKLDNLMTQVSELITNRINTEQHLQELTATISNLEDWYREWSSFKQKNRQRYHLPGAADQKMWKWLESYHEQASGLSEHMQTLGRKLDADMQQRTIMLKELQDLVLQLRLLPLSTLFDQFPRLVRDLARQEQKEINFLIEGAETQIDKRIIEEIKDPLIHLLRNCIDHGIEDPEQRSAQGKPRQGELGLRAYPFGTNIIIDVCDDGRGFNTNEIREVAIRKGFTSSGDAAGLTEQDIINFIFLPGFSTTKIITDVSGRGVGMNVVKANVERLKGTISVQGNHPTGSLFRLQLPLTIATTYVLLFRMRHYLYAMPTSSIEQVLMLKPSQIVQIEARQVIQVDGQTLAIASLAELLGASAGREDQEKIAAIVIGSAEKRLALVVDEVVGDQEVVVRHFRYPLRRVRHLTGATVLGDGTLALVLNPTDLLRSAEREERGRVTRALPTGKVQPREVLPAESARVLIVDDSITTRTLEKNILRSAGYEVAVAVDGQEALALLAQSPYDIVVTDVEMPKVDGFQLTASIKGNEKYSHIPVILVTSLQSDAHRRRGLEVGADAYITKGSFDQNNLLDTIKRLI